VIEKSKLDQKTQKMLTREISNMDIIAHPNIIRLFEVVETLTRIHLVLEFAPCGELFNRISTEGRLNESEAIIIFSQVLSAVIYLHNLSIIHRDIKAENVFMISNKRVKLGDFGFSTKVSNLSEQLSTFCGSPPYAAPELYKDESYEGPGVDIWALGVLLFFLLTADMPFKASTVAGLKRQILGGSFLIPLHVSDNARDLINKLMVQSPQERLSPSQISTHPWFRGTDAVVRDSLLPYVTFPRPSNTKEKISDEEMEVFSLLNDWGISRKSLDDSIEKGARSAIVATYRILMHHLLHADETDGSLYDESRFEGHSGINTPSEARSTAGSSSLSPKKNKFRLKNGLSKSGKLKSKACIIL
ncbi:Serine/threonine-protein kinase NIM1, partial [Armadillidium nasatum]